MNTLIKKLANVVQSNQCVLFGDWSFRVSVFYASWRRGRRCNDVAMEDKIEVTVHVISISPFLKLS